jgi:GTPase SAR1 family protein
VFVIDSADRERIAISKQELDLMLQEEELRGAPILVLANKQDLPNAMNEVEVRKRINEVCSILIEMICINFNDTFYKFR